jgi:hypothetical protein
MNQSFQLFNLDTMSGVFPGTRTMVFQRVRVRATAPAADAPANASAALPAWARLLWYDDPAACVLELNGPLLRIPDPQGADFGARLQAGLAAAGYELLACGACAHWQPLGGATTDGLATGRCTWQTDAAATATQALNTQSLLALDCPHWQVAPGRPEAPAPAALVQAAALPPIPKRAEQESDERWSWWGRLRRALRGRPQEAVQMQPAAQAWAEQIVERSGVGAGTEPCFACQGRIANLGALAVASPEGDKQTYSVWRCRLCYTYYLNDWIDRWERTDSLETEETYYRLAPQEALAILAVIEGVAGAEHPARRHERGSQAAWMQQFLGSRPPLSHQIKQGR